MIGIKCTQCGEGGLEAGFVADYGQHSEGFAKWTKGRVNLGLFGRAQKMGRVKYQIDAFRCPGCAHLELFATTRA